MCFSHRQFVASQHFRDSARNGPEAVYEPSADRFIFHDNNSDGAREARRKATKSMLRVTETEYLTYCDSPIGPFETTAYLSRVYLRLGENDARKLIKKLDRLEEWAVEKANADEKLLYSLTIIAAPVVAGRRKRN